MGTGICPFFGWENGISCTGTGIHQQKTIENGNGINILMILYLVAVNEKT